LLDPQLIQFLRHVLSYPDRAKPYVMKQLVSIIDEKHVVRLRSTKDVNNFLSAPLDFPSLSLIHKSKLPKSRILPATRIPLD
jgi:hypothetical protein